MKYFFFPFSDPFHGWCRAVRVGFTLQPEAGVRAGQQLVVKLKVVEVGREVSLLAAHFERTVGRNGLLFSILHSSPALPTLYLHLSLVTRSCTARLSSSDDAHTLTSLFDAMEQSTNPTKKVPKVLACVVMAR